MRIRRSNKSGFWRASACPYQYTVGKRADEDSAVGADVALNPRGFAGVWVGTGASMAHAEMVPGTVKQPYLYFISGHPLMRNVVQKNLHHSGLRWRTLVPNVDHSGRHSWLKSCKLWSFLRFPVRVPKPAAVPQGYQQLRKELVSYGIYLGCEPASAQRRDEGSYKLP